ncbi:MAG TPA: hypothetical protein VES64_01410 [Allosphingosinicella sp.]|nr:hypothetical protein [Allosphingosinicella sp.]
MVLLFAFGFLFMGEDEMKLIFGGAIALVLLGLYIYSVVFAVMLAQSPEGGTLNDGMLLALTTIGGLVSALVIAQLAVTKPGETPVVRTLTAAQQGSAATVTIVTWVAWIYVAAWIVLGVTAFVVGAMMYPGKVQSLTDLGQSWLGLAVPAAYAYFGLK